MPWWAPGCRSQLAAMAWLAAALDRLEAGRLVAIDYARIECRAWRRSHRASGCAPTPATSGAGRRSPRPATQDITVDVAIDQLSRVRAPSRVRSQAEFLAAHGIAELVAEGREQWASQAAAGGLTARGAPAAVSARPKR